MHNRKPLLWSLLVLLSGAIVLPSGVADAKPMEDRDRSVDWALGGLEQGSQMTRSAGQRAPAGSQTTPGSKISPTEAGANRTGRGIALPVGAAVRNATSGGESTSTNSQSGGGGTGTGSSSGNTVSGGETASGSGTTTGEQTPSSGETTDSGLNIHVEADTSLDVATGVETGIATGTDVSGQVDAGVSTDTSSTTLVGSAELTSPGAIDTSTTTELESNLSGGANDASPESDSTEAAVGDNADDCSVAGLISCPSIL